MTSTKNIQTTAQLHDSTTVPDWITDPFNVKLWKKLLKEDEKNCISLLYLIKNYKLPEDFMKKMKKQLDWYYVCQWQKLNENFMDEMRDYLDWEQVSMYQEFSSNFFIKYVDKLANEDILHRCKFDETILRDVKDYLNWGTVSVTQNISFDFIREFKDKVNWICITSKYIFTLEQMKEFKEYFNDDCWRGISQLRDLTPQIIYEFQDYLDWDYIPNNQDKTNWSDEDLKNILELKYCK